MRFSIITATYNSSKTIIDCIRSVHEQQHLGIEQIIIDGASRDNTLQTIQSIPNKVTQIISEPDNGIYDAMNKGIRMATGDIIGILNSDDFYADSDVITEIANAFMADESLEAVHTNLYYVKNDQVDKVVRHWITGDFTQGSFFKGWHPAHPTLFLRKEVYEQYGLFNLDFKLAADFEFMLRIFEKQKIKSKYLPITTVRMRLGGATSKNLANIIKGNRECLKAFAVNGLKVPYLYPLYRILPKLKQFINKR